MNEKYPTGALYIGLELKPVTGFEYESFIYSEISNRYEVFDANGIRPMSEQERAFMQMMASSWTQALGQEGNPNETQNIEMKNAEYRAYLASTDWYGVRFVETGIAVPVEIAEARTTARASVV